MAALFEDLVASVPQYREEVKNLPEAWAKVLNGKKLFVQRMTLEDRDAWEAEGLDENYKPKMQNMRARLIRYSLVDEDGVKVFPTTEVAKQMPSNVGIPIYEQAIEVNRISKESMEDVEKN